MKSSRHGLRLALFWALLVCLMALGLGRGLWTPDEPREAEIGREMLGHPSFVPHLNGAPFFEKPPLYYWVMAGSYAIAGVSNASARAVSALAGLATLALLFMWAKRAASERTAYLAVFMLATSLQFFQSTHWVLLDPLLMLFLTLAAWGAWERLDGNGSPWALAALYGGICLGVWTKGLIGVALPMAGLLLFMALKRTRAQDWARRLRLVWGLALTGLIIVLCLGAFYLAEGREALVQLVWVNHVLRFIKPGTTGHAQPFYYYVHALPMAVLPWLMPLLALFRPAFWRGSKEGSNALLRPYLGAAVLGGVLLLSAATTKRETYLLPLLPPLALLMALAMEDMAGEAGRDALSRSGRWLAGRLQPILLSVWGLALPVALIAYTHSPRPSYVAVGAVALCAGIAGAAWGFREDLARAWEAQRVSAALFCIVALALAVPVAEPQKDMAPFARWIGEQVPGRDPIPALGADETLCGIIPFTTGRGVQALSAESWSEQAASGGGPAWVLEQASQRSRDYRLSPLGYLLVRQQRFGPGRTLKLWKRFPHAEPSPP